MSSDRSREAVRVGDWVVDPTLDSVSRGDESQKLEPRTMRLLMRLIEADGAVVSQEQLLNEVWAGVIVGPTSVYQAVSQLRKIFGDTDSSPAYIATVPRKGYRLVARVLPVATAATREPALSSASPLPRRRLQWMVTGGIIAVCLGVLVVITLLERRSPDAVANSVVVLPFVDMTDQKSDQPFCDGLTEELSNWLAQIPTLRVVARTSAFAYKGHDEDVREIGKALNTSHVIEGSIRRNGEQMRVTVQLIDARNGYHLWSTTFDRATDDTIKVQEEIARSVAQSLQIRLTPVAEQRFSSRRSTNPQAYQLFMLAQNYQQQRTRDGTARAIGMYKESLKLEPQFAPAYAGLSFALLNDGYYIPRPTADVAAEVEPLIARALELEPRLSDAYAVRGALRADQNRSAEALADLDLAVELNPNDSRAFKERGRILLVAGRPRAALASFDAATALDPVDFLSELQRCDALTDLTRYDDAFAACEHARVLAPDNPLPRDQFAWLNEARGRLDEALRWSAATIDVEPDIFDRYWLRIDMYLSLGLARRAHATLDKGRTATHDEEDAKAVLAKIIYYEKGSAALRAYLDTSRLEQSSHAISLLEAAYARLVLGEPAAVPALIERALTAPDRATNLGDGPWFARQGVSYRVNLAAALLQLDQRTRANDELTRVRSMLDQMIADGVERYAIYELRAKVFALQGDADAAMRDLSHAEKLGWRRAWLAEREPYFEALRARADYQALLARVNRSNEQLLPLLTSQP